MNNTEIKALLVSENCPHCTDLKKILQDRGLLDKIKVLTYETDEGQKFAKENNITAVPECVVIKKDGKDVRVCTDKEFQELIDGGK